MPPTLQTSTWLQFDALSNRDQWHDELIAKKLNSPTQRLSVVAAKMPASSMEAVENIYAAPCLGGDKVGKMQ